MKQLSKIAFAAFFGLAVLVGASVDASAQGNSRWAHEKNRIRKQQKAIEKAQKHGYRLYRGGSYYDTDRRGYDILREAVRRGYEIGWRQGANDRRYRNGGDPYYRGGGYGYDPYVDRGQYDYYFREGFERGYRDGYNSQSRYGYYSGGKWTILANILGGILNMRTY